MGSPDFYSAWFWRLEDFYFADHRIYGKGSRCKYDECVVWHKYVQSAADVGKLFHTAFRSQLFSVYTALYSMCSSNCSN